MAQTKVTADLLREFAQSLRTESERFYNIKGSMDSQLHGFWWDDPVAVRFKSRYTESLEPIEKKLLPAMDKYQQHLDKEAVIVDTWLQD